MRLSSVSGLAAALALAGVPLVLAFPTSISSVSPRAVPPAGSDLFNPGTLSHPLVPVTNVVSGVVQDETGANAKAV
ncbi:hypothetical protein PsYK624_037700 [Phanerochaete sordida]|uniref:Uncharacterized protein n=1 Tax=Phanerochaete sordida TaxID=48140 RepID=A0A9P3LBC4_9APHY|nr:hypothetical protein PsYK624_037700 [Phanerochaete sordida]